MQRAMTQMASLQAQTSLDDEVDVYPEQPTASNDRRFSRQDSASSSTMAGKDAAAGFKGAFKKVANGLAGALRYNTTLLRMQA